MEKFRVGIAGYGVVGKRRRKFIDLNPHLITVAISDVTFSGDGVFPDGVVYFDNYEKIFNQQLDVLFVSLPNYLAAGATITGLENGCHVFCEKPPGRDIKDIKNVISIEKKYPKLKLKYGFNHRYHASVKETKKIIDSRKNGEIINIRGVYGKSNIIPFNTGWRSERKYAGGGILLDQGIHMLDMIRYFAGNFDEIKSFVSNSYWRHDVEDNVYAIMRNKNGCVAMIHSTATQWQHKFRLEITLRDALLELTGILSGSKSYGEEKLKVVPRNSVSAVGSFHEITNSFLEDNSWKDEINEFADIIIQDKLVENGNSQEALMVMEMVYKIYCADEAWSDIFNIQI
jgi:predicted dehydrogenase